MKDIKDGIFESAYFDVYDGARHSITRLRQLQLLVQDGSEYGLWPLAIVNAASCLEWFARNVVQELIDFGAEQINPDARILRDLKISYALILQTRSTALSIGTVVAMSRNFSSFDEIDSALTDLMNNPKPSGLSRVAAPLSRLIDAALGTGKTRKALARDLNEMFARRHELVHGSPRHMAFENEGLFKKKELLRFIYSSLRYIKQMNATLYKFLPELAERTTRDINRNQSQRRMNSDAEIDRLVQAIERRIGGDADLLEEFRQAQQAWKTWRDKESTFQSADWRGGTGRPAVTKSYRTSINMERLRSLEMSLRGIDNSP